MNLPPIAQRHPALRWLAPIAVVGIAGLAATGVFHSRPTTHRLPQTSPAALIAAVQAPKISGFSGTLVSRLNLGLPELPAVGDAGDGASLTSLLSGSHTLQFWYGGADQQRLALLGATDETDFFRSGRDVWQWNSADHVALHGTLPAPTVRSAAQGTTSAVPSPTASLTPSGLATTMLEKLDPTTEIVVKNNLRVADRSAYELILTPRTPATKVGSVRIAVDGVTKVPLAVQVFARDETTPAVDVSFSTVRFVQPAETYFRFRPPADAAVHQLDMDDYLSPMTTAGGDQAGDGTTPRLTTFNTTWSTVYTYRLGRPVHFGDGLLSRAFRPVSGSWGSGRLLTSDLVSALVTTDGRVYAGAVDPDDLYLAAGPK